MDFSSVFSDAFDTLTDWLHSDVAKTGAKGVQNYFQTQAKEQELRQRLGNVGGRPSASAGRYSSSESRAVTSVDPLAFEAVWKDRLAKLTGVERTTGVSAASGSTTSLASIQKNIG